MTLKQKRITVVSVFATLIAISVVLYFTDPVNEPFYSCPFHEHLHILCPTCGFTRMAYSMLHLDFAAAFHYNAFFTVASIPLAYVYGAFSLNIYFDRKILPLPFFKLRFVLIPLFLLLLFTVLRNILPFFAI